MNLGARCHVLIFLFLILWATLAFAQGQKIQSDNSQSLKRDLWFRHGRILLGQSAAALRYRAQGQKLQLRALHAAQARVAVALPRDISTTTWKPLGPLPLASDASGLGTQDYGWVSGRATAVAIDPADGTGNTVHIGGAFGGVWKSSNAGSHSVNPSSVTWTPVTDN